MKRNAVLIGALAGAMLVTPVLAASGEACLMHNRIMSWRAIDDMTLEFTDINYKRYTVKMQSRCEGVTMGGAQLEYQTWTNLSCLAPGQIIQVRAPGLIRGSCSVASVEAAAPATAPAPG